MMVPEEKKRNVLRLKASDAEVALIQKRMKLLGTSNRGAYLRDMAINGYIIKIDWPEIREMIRLLHNMTNNINQIAARVNAGGKLYETEIDEIKENQQTLWDILNRILSKLENAH